MLKVNWAVTLYTDPGVNTPYLYIYYSINGGSSWNLLGMETALGSGTLTHELGGAQDETQVQVKASVSAYTDGTVTTIIHTALYDVWIDGTYTPVAGSGKKAAANLT